MKVVRTDNGGKYRRQFQEYCKAQCIRLEYTLPNTLELNGLAKRMNQTIMERVRSRQSHAKLPKSHWVEAMLIVVYLINMSPSLPLKGDVPHGYGEIKMFWTMNTRRWMVLCNIH